MWTDANTSCCNDLPAAVEICCTIELSVCLSVRGLHYLYRKEKRTDRHSRSSFCAPTCTSALMAAFFTISTYAFESVRS